MSPFRDGSVLLLRIDISGICTLRDGLFSRFSYPRPGKKNSSKYGTEMTGGGAQPSQRHRPRLHASNVLGGDEETVFFFSPRATNGLPTGSGTILVHDVSDFSGDQLTHGTTTAVDDAHRTWGEGEA